MQITQLKPTDMNYYIFEDFVNIMFPNSILNNSLRNHHRKIL